jgi:hypothetical protein
MIYSRYDNIVFYSSHWTSNQRDLSIKLHPFDRISFGKIFSIDINSLTHNTNNVLWIQNDCLLCRTKYYKFKIYVYCLFLKLFPLEKQWNIFCGTETETYGIFLYAFSNYSSCLNISIIKTFVVLLFKQKEEKQHCY